MREIKFRAWDGEKIHPDVIRTLSFCLIADNITVEQFTGLHDKNGNELYEGDIVKVYGFSKVTVGKVIYEDYYFTLDGFCDISTDRPEMAFSESEFEVNYEVIGNIHENPGLLEGK